MFGVPEHIQAALEQLAYEFSPEILTADGELSYTEVRRRTAYLEGEWSALEKMAGVTVPKWIVEEAGIKRFMENREANQA